LSVKELELEYYQLVLNNLDRPNKSLSDTYVDKKFGHAYTI